MYAVPQLLPVPSEHELEQLSHRLRILLDLLLRIRIHDCQPGIHMPLVRVNPQRDVHLHVLNATHIPITFPRKLIIRRPCSAHAEKRCVCNGLRVGGDAVVLHGSEVHVLGAQTRHGVFDKGEVCVRGAVLD